MRELAKSVPGFATVVSAVRSGGRQLSVSELQALLRQSLATVLAPSRPFALSLPPRARTRSLTRLPLLLSSVAPCLPFSRALYPQQVQEQGPTAGVLFNRVMAVLRRRTVSRVRALFERL